MIQLTRLTLFFFIACYPSITLASVAPKEANATVLDSRFTKQIQNTITDSSLLYYKAHQFLQRAKKENKTILLGTAYRNLAEWHVRSKSIDSMVYYFQKAKVTYAIANKRTLQAETCLEMEEAYKQRSSYSLAMAQDFEAIALYEELKDKAGIAKCYTRLCDLMYYQEKYADGATYCQKAIEIQKKLDVPDELALSYRYKADNLLILEKYEEALLAIDEALKVLKQAGKTDHDLVPSYNSKGNIYKHMKRYDEALAMYKLNYQLTKSKTLDRYLVPTLGNIGHVYRLQGKYEVALPYMLEAIDIMKKSGNTQNLWENYMHVSESYEALKKFDKALIYSNLYFEEEIEKKNNTIRQLESELQIKYETAKKDETIEVLDAKISQQKRNQLLYGIIASLLVLTVLVMYYSLSNIRKKRKSLKLVNSELELRRKDVETSNNALRISLDDLKSTQSQLIQAEKMASLGELTAGIAHEIQNPLNFVNNFSEVSNELLDEIKEERAKNIENRDEELVSEIIDDIKQNLEKINHHGKRADAIVKGMLQHSRSTSGTKEPTDINKLADEYLRLAYHGLKAKDKSFNATLVTNYDETIGKIDIIPQDIGKVILNLITNAFYATNEKQKSPLTPEGGIPYEPKVTLSTAVSLSFGEGRGEALISVADNANGIPPKILDKIFQPFFTTKPTGQGTGLGLSLAYDIVKAHGGELKVNTEENLGTTFIIQLPLNNQQDA